MNANIQQEFEFADAAPKGGLMEDASTTLQREAYDGLPAPARHSATFDLCSLELIRSGSPTTEEGQYRNWETTKHVSLEVTERTDKSNDRNNMERKLKSALADLLKGDFNKDCQEILAKSAEKGPSVLAATLSALNKQLRESGSSIRIDGKAVFDPQGLLKIAFLFLTQKGVPTGAILELNRK